MRRNDVGQYDRLSGEWWRPGGTFAMLHWIARARAALIPPASRPDAILVDLGCGGGLLAPHLAGKGYRHIGLDLTRSALELAAAHGVSPVRADVTRVPLRDGCADAVSAGEILEHLADPAAAIGHACRVLRPGGTLVLDTLNRTLLARLVAVEIGERVPGIAARGIHDPALFVPPDLLVRECARYGVELRVRGVRPGVGILRWLVTRRGDVPIVPTRSTAVMYQGYGVKAG